MYKLCLDVSLAYPSGTGDLWPHIEDDSSREEIASAVYIL